MGKTKKETDEPNESNVKEEDLYEEKVRNANKIACPMASKRLTKKCYKLIKKASKQKTFLRNGLKDVQSRLNKGEKGIVIFAGDVTPIEIMCHLPAVCEDKGIPYAYTPSRIDLGAAMGVKRGTVTLLIREHADYQDQFNELKAEINALAAPL
ncbi:H/ACA ribonucleoprotein complex subunit 2-like protein [Pseudolycoriella hygida]|uniref:H/ACA snoRNP protein NHP2 n=1 Tax=Pseudolycoriella hygida TaxID=35572 RepID=A0A9Q0NDI4_9DIPT|nr:H/ACA ribonucleoprotein complex subunit 2-like protein [Pseudolycoriella hygida]